MLTEKTLEQLLQEKLISQRTYEKVLLSKQYIERKYNFKVHKNNIMKNIIDKLNLCNIKEEKINQIKKEIYQKEMETYRKAREKLTIKNYESISIIGRGAFGEVHVCREKKTGDIVAIKKIKKDILMAKNQILHVRNEQLLMSNAKSPWIVDLKASFQEDDYLYLVMEYCPGGDLMNLLIEKDILTEEEAKFYIAELILSIESIHKLDCIHRDIKPDNILIDSTGHIKLSDFGLAKISEKIFENREDINSNTIYHHNKNYSCVGTAYYVAPEVLNKKGYGPEIDWWSVGIIFYEMLIGYAPFCSKDTNEVCYKVINWKKYFKFPSKIKISTEAEDLIIKLVNSPNKRLGKNGASEIKNHPFFKDLDWENIRNIKPPFIPKLKNSYDTKYFETFDENESFYPTPSKYPKRKDIEYLGYTYKEDNDIFNEHKKLEKSIFDEIKKIIKTEENKTSITNYSSSGSGIIPSSNNIKVYYKNKNNSNSLIKNKKIKKNSNSSIKNKKNNNLLEILKIENNYNEPKLNIIQLPKRKSKMNMNKKEDIELMNIINKENISSRIINTKIKLKIKKVNSINRKNSKLNRLSPMPKPDIILKILNLSKTKKISKEKTKSIKNSRSKKNNNSNRSQLKNDINNDTSFNYNSSLLNKLFKKPVEDHNIKKIINTKWNNNIKVIKKCNNKSYNKVSNSKNKINYDKIIITKKTTS